MKTTQRRKFMKSLGLGLALPYLNLGSHLLHVQKDLLDIQKRSDDSSEDYWALIKSQFSFAPELRYFNNASLGGSPLLVQKATTHARDTLDGFPSKYMWGGWDVEKEKVRQSIADLFSVSNEEIALIHNTTEGMNLIARSFDLEPGDEVILGDHEHPSGRICWEVFQETKGIKIVRPTLPLLPQNEEAIVEAYRKAITPKTKIISICHIVNTNGMILPIKKISEMAHAQGILVAVDGAQGAGMISIDLHDLGCDFYTASAHKWLFAPKGTGILYAKQSSQSHLKPLIVCRGHKDQSIRRLENYNTRNLPELLGLGRAIEFYNRIGKQKIHDRSFELKNYFRSKIEAIPSLQLKTPALDAVSAAIQVVEIIDKNVNDAKEYLSDDYNIDCRPMSTFDLNALRFSLAIYITKADIDYLADALETYSNS